MAALLWSSRAAVRGKWAVSAAALGITGLFLLAASIVWGDGWEWVPGAALLVAAQLVALGAVRSGADDSLR